MEHLGAIFELNWNSSDESEVIMAQLLGAFPDMNEQDQEASFGVDAMFWPHQGASSYSLLDNLGSCWPGTSNTISTSAFFPPTSEFQSYELGDPSAVSASPMDYFMSEEQMSGSSLMVEELICSKDDENELKDNVASTTTEDAALTDHNLQAKRKLLESKNDNKDDGIPTGSPKKMSRVSSQAQKSVKNARSKKAQKNAGTSEDALSNASYSSEDESNTSKELNEGACSSSKGKTRAGRGSATDPQSLYARKRRGRINERLRILQKLVPNGTKVDISTMLEEAVQYVKFLQLQIKLLSSDDLWMYAPLACSGMDIGLDLKFPLPQQ